MSSDAFDRLRAKHPGQFTDMAALEASLTQLLHRFPRGVVDAQVLHGQTGMPLDSIYDVLVALVGEHVLDSQLLWVCPNLGGTIQEAYHVSHFPLHVDCPVCGLFHDFDKGDVEVAFVPSSNQASGTGAGER